jgi:quercetin dioxygenase-like cupin family protein
MSERLWFLDTLVTIHTGEGISMVESVAPAGDSPPLHIHHTEDELFHVLQGELTLHVGDDERRLTAGDTAVAPKGVAHTYRVDSADGARWLVVTGRGDFERMVRSMSRPAERDELPAHSGPPTPQQQDALAVACRESGIELVGPPLAA